MKEIAYKVKRKVKQKLQHIKYVLEDNSGLSVVEMILILVGILTPYYGVGIRCIG